MAVVGSMFAQLRVLWLQWEACSASSFGRCKQNRHHFNYQTFKNHHFNYQTLSCPLPYLHISNVNSIFYMVPSLQLPDIQTLKFRTEHFPSFVCSCVLRAHAISAKVSHRALSFNSERALRMLWLQWEAFLQS